MGNINKLIAATGKPRMCNIRNQAESLTSGHPICWFWIEDLWNYIIDPDTHWCNCTHGYRHRDQVSIPESEAMESSWAGWGRWGRWLCSRSLRRPASGREHLQATLSSPYSILRYPPTWRRPRPKTSKVTCLNNYSLWLPHPLSRNGLRGWLW